MKKGLSTRDVASGGVMIAVTAALTLLIRIPIVPTRGYLNFGDAMIFFQPWLLEQGSGVWRVDLAPLSPI
jgi:Protein of unknown function (DUF1393).